MIPARVSERPFSFPPMDVELLAEHEHSRWMELNVKNDWRYARERNDKAKLHPDLLPWRSKLIDEERREAIGEDELSEAGKRRIEYPCGAFRESWPTPDSQ